MYGVPNDADLLEGYGFIGPEDLPSLGVEFVIDCLVLHLCTLGASRATTECIH